jgi:hypothetical protein
MIKVKFLTDNKYMDHPGDPIIKVSAGEVLEVGVRLAQLVVEAGKGEYYTEPKAVVEQPKKRKTGPKKKSEAGPTPKAEASPVEKAEADS